MPFFDNPGAAARGGAERYPVVLRGFHWLIVLLLVLQFSDAWTMPHIGRGTVPVGLIAWHLFFGTTILAVMLLRLGWRARMAVPAAPANLPRPLELMARLAHYILYFGVIIIAVLGWANASSRGWNVKLLGFIPLPPIMPKGSSLGHQLGDVHHLLATALLYVIGVHVAAALYHAAVLRDGLLRRMI